MVELLFRVLPNFILHFGAQRRIYDFPLVLLRHLLRLFVFLFPLSKWESCALRLVAVRLPIIFCFSFSCSFSFGFPFSLVDALSAVKFWNLFKLRANEQSIDKQRVVQFLRRPVSFIRRPSISGRAFASALFLAVLFPLLRLARFVEFYSIVDLFAVRCIGRVAVYKQTMFHAARENKSPSELHWCSQSPASLSSEFDFHIKFLVKEIVNLSNWIYLESTW